ncbi:MAG: hypothetical protein WC549_02080 [Actinomycetota bacterium]
MKKLFLLFFLSIACFGQEKDTLFFLDSSYFAYPLYSGICDTTYTRTVYDTVFCDYIIYSEGRNERLEFSTKIQRGWLIFSRSSFEINLIGAILERKDEFIPENKIIFYKRKYLNSLY